jgi:hypothetical protein
LEVTAEVQRINEEMDIKKVDRRKGVFLALFLMFILTIPIELEGCSCVCRDSFKNWVSASFKGSTAVFIGRVLEVKLERTEVSLFPGGRKFPRINYKERFAVEEPFKGVTDSSIWADTGDGDCSPGELKVGQRYLIYAFRPTSNGNLFVGSCCNRSREMTNPLYSKSENKERIKEIELLRRLKARDERISNAR